MPLQQLQHCYPVLTDPDNFYCGKIVRIREALRVRDILLFRVTFGSVSFVVRPEFLK